jgi:ferredoxin
MSAGNDKATTPADGNPLVIHTENCGNCIFCISVCPFEALSQDPETKKVRIDVTKCRFCGICYGACPSNLIEVALYDTTALSDHVTRALEASGKGHVVVACRGNTLPAADIRAIASKEDAVLMSLPCLGRISIGFLINVVQGGAGKLVLIPCKEDLCRFKDGSKVLQSRVQNANLMLEDMGFPPDSIEVVRGARPPVVDKAMCIACGLCVRICPYGALSITRDEAGKRTSTVDAEKCHLCGLCVASCPQRAQSMPTGEGGGT